MKFTILRETLLKPLNRLVCVADKKHAMPILSNVFIEVSDDVFLKATDLETEVCVNLEAENIILKGMITIPLHKLLQIIRAFRAESVVLFEIIGTQIKINSDNSEFLISTISGEQFPDMEQSVYSGCLTLPQADLLNTIKHTQISMANNDVRYFLNGMLWEITENNLRMVSTDGHRLSTSNTFISSEYNEKLEIIIPAKSIKEMQKILQMSEDTVEVHFSSHHIKIVLPKYSFVTKLIDGRYPDYIKVIPTNNNLVMTANVNNLKVSLERTAILANEKYKSIRFILSNNMISLKSNNAEDENAVTNLEVEYFGEDIEMGFNVKYLIDILSIIDTEQVEFKFKNSSMSLLVESPNNSDAQYVVMPIRL